MFPFSRPHRKPAPGGFRGGEVLRISCPSAQARVARVTEAYIMLTWPWGEVDPASTKVRWDGTLAFPRDPEHPEWHNTPWRIEVSDVRGVGVRDLSAADVCTVGIPPTRVRVRAVRRHEPPADLGRLPRPELTLSVVFLGDEHLPDAGFGLYLPSAEPLLIEHEDTR